MTTETSRPTILIVDDTPANIQLLANGLRQDYAIRVATSGPDALELLRVSPKVDLILLDIMMPDMDGHEVCRRIKANPATQGIPVMFVTAVETLEAEEAGLKLGAADYLVKPIHLGIARQRIHNLIERERLRQAVETERDRLEERVAERTAELAAVAGAREKALQAAEHLSAVRSQFINNMSHELRTPLNHILGMAHLCQRTKELDKARDYARMMEEAGERLLHIVNAVLDYSSVRLDLSREAIDLKAETKALLEKWRARARAKGLEFEVRLPEEALPPVLGDARRLRQVLDEVLENAVKFTAHGQVGVAAHLAGERVEISIRDSGIGMSSEQLEAGLEPFRQSDGSSTRRYGGIGLGLALSDYLIGLMGGHMKIESREGSGTTVVIALPILKG